MAILSEKSIFHWFTQVTFESGNEEYIALHTYIMLHLAT